MKQSRYNIIFDIEGRKDKLLLNPLSQSIDLLDGKQRGLLEYLRGNSVSFPGRSDDLDYLITRGYLYDHLEDEDSKIKALVERDNNEEYPFDFLLYPTFHCNLKCSYCFQSENYLPEKYKMISKDYVDNIFKAIGTILQSKKIKPARPLIYLFGGEPLLYGKGYKEIIGYILSQAYHKDYRTGIITNGSNLAYYSEIIKKYKVEFVQVTLDGPKHIHDQRRKYVNGKGTFDDILTGIRSLIDCNIKLFIRINLDYQNIATLPEFADYAIKAGWDNDNVVIFVGPYRDLVCRPYKYQLREDLMLKKIFSFYEQAPHTKIIKLIGWPGLDYILYFLHTGSLLSPRISYCISSYGRFGFDNEGYVYACGNAAGKNSYSIGTYYHDLKLDQDKSTIWRKCRVTDFHKCLHCKLAFICGSGCTFQSLLKHKGTNPFCPEIGENLKVIMNYYFDRIVKGARDEDQQI